jgi:hypothetical protein
MAVAGKAGAANALFRDRKRKGMGTPDARRYHRRMAPLASQFTLLARSRDIPPSGPVQR